MSRGYNDRSRQRVSLLVRNLPLDARYRSCVLLLLVLTPVAFIGCLCCRADEVREKFERFGEIRDVYLPRDYYTGYEKVGIK